MSNKIKFLRFFAPLVASLLLVLPARQATAQSQRSAEGAASTAPSAPGQAAAPGKGGGQAAKPAQAPAKSSQAATKSRPVRQASENPSTARREAAPARKAKPKKPRAAEESPGSTPRHSGPTMTAGASVPGPQASAAPSGPSPAPRPSMGEAIGLKRGNDPLALQSSVAFVVDARSGEVLLGKNPSAVLPIASITKLMTAMVVLDAGLPLGERLQIGREDIDRMRHTGSRLHPGARLTRGELLQLALMASENRAANALGRHYPGGMPAFVAAMNAKARGLGMQDSRFVEPTGLSSANVASARDLARLVRAAAGYPAIRQYSTARSMTVKPAQEPLGFYNTNRLISTTGWAIGLQKTGFISEAGNCLVMLATIEGRQTIVVLLDAAGKLARFDDAQRIRGWLAKGTDPRSAPMQREAAPAVAPLRVTHETH